MPKITHITVTAPEGRVAPIHADDWCGPGGEPPAVRHGVVCRVKYSQTVRRAIARGDLIPCDMDGKRAASANAASAPRDIERKPPREIA